MQLFQLKSKPHKIERLKLFLSEGFISIGYPGIGDLTNASIQEIEEALAHTYKEYTGQSLAFHKGMVNAFVNTMQVNDIVLIADGDSVHIGQVKEYKYDPDYDNDEGMCHRRNVDWLATTQRHYLNTKVQDHLKNRATITKFKYPIEEADLFEYLTGNQERILQIHSKSEIYEKAWNVLVNALESEEEHIRVLAATAIYQSK